MINLYANIHNILSESVLNGSSVYSNFFTVITTYTYMRGKKDMAMGGNRMCVGKRSVLELLPHLKEMCVYELQFSSLVG